MIKKMNIVLVFVIASLLLSPDRSFANLSGGGLFASPNRGGGSRGGAAPQYHSFEDLRDYLRDRERFHFENSNKPANALVSLGYYMSYPAYAAANAQISSQIKANPSKYKIDSSHIYSNWREGQKSIFDWNKYRNDLCVGDLVFTRGDDKLNNLAKFFSNWTHVVIVSNPESNLIFDSTLDSGVQEHKVADQWQGFGYFTCKRIDGMPYGEKYLAVQRGIAKYKGLPYLPKIETAVDIFTFVSKWCDKNDKSSMYCSKLVYNVLNPYMSIDTRRTSVDENSRLRDTAPGNYFFSWIGVSPDNVYYSTSLSPDFDFSGNI
jgi:hypothetical protein